MPDITNLEQTKQYARQLAQSLKPGDIVGLVGDLGAGKTTLVQEIAHFWGIKRAITSPTYTFVKEYPLPQSKLTLVHIDVYRLENQSGIQSLGLNDYFRDNTIILIEWANKIADFLPKKTIWLEIKQIDSKRTIRKHS